MRGGIDDLREKEYMEIRMSPLVVTEHLEIRPMTESDMDEMLALFVHPDIYRTYMIPVCQTREEYVRLAARLILLSAPEERQRLFRGIYLRGRLIGFVNDCGIEEDTIEIGYVIHPAMWGCGYATEVLNAVLGELKTMGFKKVIAGFFEENPASGRVMEKCGMRMTDRTDMIAYRGREHRCLYREIIF